MPDYYGHSLIVIAADPEADTVRTSEWADGLLQRLLPEPEDLCDPDPGLLSEASLAWRLREWGCKWDVAGVLPPGALPCDGAFFHVAFHTAYTPPNAAMRKLAIHDAERFGFRVLSWVGTNPVSRTVANLMPGARHAP